MLIVPPEKGGVRPQTAEVRAMLQERLRMRVQVTAAAAGSASRLRIAAGEPLE